MDYIYFLTTEDNCTARGINFNEINTSYTSGKQTLYGKWSEFYDYEIDETNDYPYRIELDTDSTDFVTNLKKAIYDYEIKMGIK